MGAHLQFDAAAHAAHLADRAETLIDAGAFEQALELADAAARAAPFSGQGHAARARALRALGDADGALTALEDALRCDPACAPAQDARAVLLAEAGQFGEARAGFEAALELDPRFARAHFGLAALDRVRPAQLAAMEALAADPAPLDRAQRLFLIYALAKAYDEAGDVARAFACAEVGAAARRARWRGDEAAAHARLAEAWPRDEAAACGDPTDKPIFVFGLPRSGTTLIEQILASHRDVHALGETELFAREAEREPDPERLAAAYLAHWPAPARAARRVVDKSLGNFLHIAAIRRAFPNARLILARRDPLDGCLSIHFTLFSRDMPFPPDLAGLGRYQRAYGALTAAWRAALAPSALHEVGYERLVADFEGQARALLAFCGLTWDERCLAFHASTRRVTTASLAQVRRPLYASAVGRARRYAALLDPLRAALETSDAEPAPSGAPKGRAP